MYGMYVGRKILIAKHIIFPDNYFFKRFMYKVLSQIFINEDLNYRKINNSLQPETHK